MNIKTVLQKNQLIKATPYLLIAAAAIVQTAFAAENPDIKIQTDKFNNNICSLVSGNAALIVPGVGVASIAVAAFMYFTGDRNASGVVKTALVGGMALTLAVPVATILFGGTCA